MDTKRAREIVSSPVMTNVTYNGASVYIERVHDNRQTAHIHPIDQPNRSQEVSLSKLNEE